MIGEAVKFSRRTFVGGVMAIGLVWILAAPGRAAQTQGQTSAAAQAVARALADLYQVAQSITNKPAGEAEEHPGGPPTFPYPDSMRAQWDSTFAANEGGLTPNEHKAYVDCGGHLKNAILDTEQGYTVEDTQPKSNTGAQESAQKSYAEGKAEFAKCDPAAYALAQSESGSSASTPQQGGTDTTVSPEQTPAPAPAEQTPATTEQTPAPAPAENSPAGTPETPTSDTTPPSNTAPPTASNGPIVGSVEEADEPGSIDWTPTLDPLFTYLQKEWNLVASDPKNKDWAADDAGNTLTLKLQPNQAPEVESISGARSSSLRTITENGLPVTPFPNGSKLSSVVVAPTFNVKPKMGQKRTRMKYYERNGIFKSYSVAQ